MICLIVSFTWMLRRTARTDARMSPISQRIAKARETCIPGRTSSPVWP